jgi:hypothetical protein
MPYKFVVKPLAARRIWSFYRNVAKKYSNTYAEEDIARDVKRAVRSILLIESRLLRRTPTINRWNGKYMAHSGYWYYAYTIDGDTITVHDACHQQNMHD